MENNITFKSDLQKMWKKLVTTARFPLCQLFFFTNCSQQSKTTDFTVDSTKRNQKTMEELDVLTNNNIKVDILSACESAKYLGQTFTFQQQETAEIKNRIRAAWASFHRYKQGLTSRSSFLPHRLRLFIMVITASGTWTPSKEHGRMLRSTQRKNISLHHPNKEKNSAQQERRRRRRQKC